MLGIHYMWKKPLNYSIYIYDFFIIECGTFSKKHLRLIKQDKYKQVYQQVNILTDLISKGSMSTVMNIGGGPELIQ